MTKLLKNPLVRFLGLGSLLYLTWYSLYEFYIRPQTTIDLWVIHRIVDHSRWLLEFAGFALEPRNDVGGFFDAVAIRNSPGVTVGAPCDGMALFGLFSVFVLAYPGRVVHKLWFIPAGIAVVHAVNVARVAGLAVIMDLNPSWLAFNHDYTFTLLVYGVVFGLWYIWVQRFGPSLKTQKQ
jgi:exosortase family protein XrtF